jgi:hypothetical protein
MRRPAYSLWGDLAGYSRENGSGELGIKDLLWILKGE